MNDCLNLDLLKDHFTYFFGCTDKLEEEEDLVQKTVPLCGAFHFLAGQNAPLIALIMVVVLHPIPRRCLSL